MKSKTSKKAFEAEEQKVDALLSVATKKGGFERLSAKEKADLAKYTAVVKSYEDEHYSIPMPQTMQGLIELKMYEKNMKQKELAKVLGVTDTKLSAIMHKKRKPNVVFLKAMNQKLGIDGNILLKAV